MRVSGAALPILLLAFGAGRACMDGPDTGEPADTADTGGADDSAPLDDTGCPFDDCAGLLGDQVGAVFVDDVRCNHLQELAACEPRTATEFTTREEVASLWASSPLLDTADRPSIEEGTEQLVCIRFGSWSRLDWAITGIREAVHTSVDMLVQRKITGDAGSCEDIGDTGRARCELWLTPVGEVDVCDYRE